MLDSIKITNFKKIQSPEGLTLSNLGRVNYLVGENGCGKSSVGAAIILLDRHFTDDTIVKRNNQEVTKKTVTLKKQLNIDYNSITYIDYKTNLDVDSEYSIYGHEQIVGEVSTQDPQTKITTSKKGMIVKQLSFKYTDFLIIEKIITYIYPKEIDNMKLEIIRYHIKQGGMMYKSAELSYEEYIELNPKVQSVYEQKISEIASGLRYFYCLIECIDRNIFAGKKILIIEEPESGLHPKAQKILAKYFQDLIDNNDIQLFICTHSPFIISAAAEFENQKVYLIEDGQTVDYVGGEKRKGVYKNRGDGKNYIAGSNGYPAKKAVSIAAKMLGAGLNDLLDTSVPLNKTQTIILCESENSDIAQLDETVYTTIFQDILHDKKSRFSSSGSKIDVVRNVAIMNELKTTTAYRGIIDKDISNDEIYKDQKQIFRIDRYNIESYLFDPDVISKISELESFSIDEYKKEFNRLDVVNNNIGHKNTNSLKEFIKKYIPGGQWKYKNNDLAQIIYDHKHVEGSDIQDLYLELEKRIFVSSEK